MTNNMKKITFKKWGEIFPELKLYSSGKLYRRLGPLIIGIELIKLPWIEEYRPHFVMYSLWGNKMGKDINACLAGPILVVEFRDNNESQFSIPYIIDNDILDPIIRLVRESFPIPIQDQISIVRVLSVIDEYAKSTKSSHNSYLQAVLLEIKLDLTLYLNIDAAKKKSDQIQAILWDSSSFKKYGVDIELWLKNINAKPSKRAELIKQVELNSTDKKIANLGYSELIN